MPETTKQAKSHINDQKKGNNKKRNNKNQRKKGAPKWKNVVAEIEGLKKRIAQEVPLPGLYYKYKAKYENEQDNPESSDAANKLNNKSRLITNRKVLETDDKTKIKIRFSDLPISKATNNGLYKAKFFKMTEVQRAAISHAIAGRDVVVGARTGSGKTLSYLVPIFERLYHERWSSIDGLGALILVPVRELALQAFEVLISFGAMHDLSAGLAIRGKDLNYEQERIKGMNILVCTPGRLLQHMNESEGLDTSNLKMLVIDEVDRILDMGFKNTMEQIMRYLPKKTQTITKYKFHRFKKILIMYLMLFSATVGNILKEHGESQPKTRP